MEKELGPVDRDHDGTILGPGSSALLEESETLEAFSPGCDILELRTELDLAQLDHPARWAKLSR